MMLLRRHTYASCHCDQEDIVGRHHHTQSSSRRKDDDIAMLMRQHSPGEHSPGELDAISAVAFVLLRYVC